MLLVHIYGLLVLLALVEESAGCSNYRKIDGDVCADSCMNRFLGTCPRAIIVKTGGMEEGLCSEAGFDVSEGAIDQPAGPCGTLKFNTYSKEGAASAAGCSNYRKIDGDVCADTCMTRFLGTCPRVIIVTTGGMEEGLCSEAGFDVSNGTIDQPAGPCGTLKFNTYSKQEQSIGAASEPECEHYRRIENGECADACIGSFLGFCPRALVVSAGELEEGKCCNAGYTVPTDELDQKAGPCGRLLFKMYEKADGAASEPVDDEADGEADEEEA